MAVTFVQSSAPALSRTAAPPGLLRGGSTSGKYAAGMDASYSAPSMLAFAAAASTGLLGLAGSRQKGRRSSQHNVVKCRAMPAQGDVPSKEAVAEAKKKADLLMWAAKTLEGQPQAAEMKAKAESKMQVYESLKAAFEQGAPAAPVAAAAPPAAAVPQPAAQSVGGNVPSKEEVAAAKKKADLIVWAASTLSAQGSPEAAAMQARATRKVQEYESLKAAFEQGTPAAPVAAAAPAAAAPPAAAPAAAAPAAPAGGTKPTPEELAQFKKEADLMVWAANALSAKGAPQAAEMQAKAQQKVATYESLKALAAA